MTALRFISTMLITTLFVLGIIVLFTPTKRSQPSDSPTVEVLDFSQAESLNEGDGIASLEELHTLWVLDLSVQDSQAGREAMVYLLTHVQTESARQLAIDGLVSTGTEDWPSDYRGDFLRELAPGALEAAVAYGVPASITLAQAIQESGWGRSGLARQHNNLFGVKAGGVANGVEMKTEEFASGVSQSTRARFRTFATRSEALEHHGALLSGDHRYADARENAANWRSFLAHMAPVYASDPAYAQRVGWLIERYDLDRWDPLVNAVVAQEV